MCGAFEGDCKASENEIGVLILTAFTTDYTLGYLTCERNRTSVVVPNAISRVWRFQGRRCSK